MPAYSPALMKPKTLTTRSIHAFGWGSAGSLVKLLVQIGTQVFLARLLGPEQYGLFAIGAIVISFSNFFSDVGIAYGLIQRPVVTNEHIRFVFTWQLVLGATVALLIVAFAGPIAAMFKEPRAHAILLALAPICFVQAAAAVSLNLLKRTLDFKALQIAQTSGYVVGYVCIGVPLALLGWQVWALVAAWAAQAIVTFALLYGQVRHAARPLLRHTDERELTGFGLKVLATNLTNWAIGNIERVVIARHMPAAAVGLYATPYNLMYTPSTTVMGVVQPVMYAACARIQGEQERIGKAYLTLVAAISLATLPLFGAIAVIAPTFVQALYGPAWAEAAYVLRPIALAMPLFLLWNIATPVLWTNGRPGLEFKLQLPLAAVWLVTTLVAVQYSLAAVAWTVCALYGCRFAVFVLAAAKIIRVRPRAYFEAVRGGLFLGAISSGVAWTTVNAADALGIHPAAFQLVMVIIACMVACLGCIRVVPGLVGEHLSPLIDQTASRFPTQLAALVKSFLPKAGNK